MHSITNNTELDIEQLKFVKLSDQHMEHLTNFDCLDTKEDLIRFKRELRKKFRKHSKEINNFIQNEALQEQKQELNATHLLYYKDKFTGFISLCADSIRLELEERQQYKVPYANIPAIKIARLAIHKDYQKRGLGTFLINYAISLALKTRKYVGIKFITVDCYKHRLTYYKDKLGFVVNNSQISNKHSDSPISLRLHIDKYLEELQD